MLKQSLTYNTILIPGEDFLYKLSVIINKNLEYALYFLKVKNSCLLRYMRAEGASKVFTTILILIRSRKRIGINSEIESTPVFLPITWNISIFFILPVSTVQVTAALDLGLCLIMTSTIYLIIVLLRNFSSLFEKFHKKPDSDYKELPDIDLCFSIFMTVIFFFSMYKLSGYTLSSDSYLLRLPLVQIGTAAHCTFVAVSYIYLRYAFRKFILRRYPLRPDLYSIMFWITVFIKSTLLYLFWDCYWNPSHQWIYICYLFLSFGMIMSYGIIFNNKKFLFVLQALNDQYEKKTKASSKITNYVWVKIGLPLYIYWAFGQNEYGRAFLNGLLLCSLSGCLLLAYHSLNDLATTYPSVLLTWQVWFTLFWGYRSYLSTEKARKK